MIHFSSLLPQLIFYTFAATAIIAAVLVITLKNPVRSVLSLILCFFATAALWIFLEAEFLAITLVLVYVGAVMVLFLFVVMMLDIEVAALKEGFTRYMPLGFAAALLFVAALVYIINGEGFSLHSFPIPKPKGPEFNQVQDLSIALYTRYVYPFELAGILLLVAIVAAISLTFRGRRGSLAPDPARQVAVRKSDRLRIVKISPDIPPEIPSGNPRDILPNAPLSKEGKSS